MEENQFFDLLVVAPLVEEADAIFETFRPKVTTRHSNILVSEVDLRVSGLTGAVVQLPQMGNQEAYEATTLILQQYRAGVVVCIGIGGRLSADLRLGDVCYTGTVFDVHQRQKVTDTAKGRGVMPAFSADVYQTPFELETDFSFIRTHPELRNTRYRKWQEDGGERLIAIRKRFKNIREPDERFRDRPIALNGKIACGAVSASRNYNARLKSMERSLLAIETESGGVFRAARQHNDTPAITIRGIADFADAQKNKLEQGLKGAGRELAVKNAVDFFQAQLSNSYFLEFLEQRRRQVRAGSTKDLFVAPHQPPNLRSTLDDVMAAITGHLRELSPEYKLQPKGYVLPAARVTPLSSTPGPTGAERPYIEIREALTESRVVIVDVPRSYPDQSLPWVIADNLSTAVIQDRQVVPLVVRGDEIVPPKTGLSSLCAVKNLDGIYDDKGAQIIFVIHGFDLSSKSRGDFLAAEIERYSDARFLFLTKNEGSLLLENYFVQQVAARSYSIADVPFIAIANFVEKNFGLPPNEAEVIAYRLHNAFEKFKLLAHPTYFAGIPKETLSKLLQANRRSELIQFAVDGFLAFVVAGDESDISLSLTTRKRFLSLLAIELAVKKQTLTQQQLLDLAKDFAGEYDFEIDALRFVNTFVEKGILRFQGDYVEFTLPFIEHYLLAFRSFEGCGLGETPLFPR